MVKGDRGIDIRFLGEDFLFHRCTTEDMLGDRLNPARIRYDRTSCNWSRYSKPWDVIFDYPQQGIVRFIVRHLPKQLPSQKPDKNAKEYSFLPLHAPEELNYAHCEIRTFKGSELQEKSSLPQVVKKEFKTIMSDRCFVLRWPQV